MRQVVTRLDFDGYYVLFYAHQLSRLLRTRKHPLMEEPPAKPSGTIAVLFIYALIILALWGLAYLALLLRGATQ